MFLNSYRIMVHVFEAAKWERKIWAVLDKSSGTFSDIGKGKRFCEKKALELNRELEECFNDPLLANV
jgi:hypothetical protein